MNRSESRISLPILAALSLVALPAVATAQGTLFVEGDNVGIGIATPTAPLHIQKSDGSAQVFVEEVSGTTALRTQFRMVNNGAVNTRHETGGAVWRQQFQDNAYTLTKDGTGGNEVTIIGSTGDMTIRGSLFTAGPTCDTGCDAVLDPSFPLETIEEHTTAMRNAGYLPAVGPTKPRETINVSEKIGGLLNELEKAHLFIAQLHERLEEQDRYQVRSEAVEAELERRDAEIAKLNERLERLESDLTR